MRHTRGAFSLIETLVAVIIASLCSLALLEVAAKSSSSSARSMERFQVAAMAGAIASSADRDGRSADALDILQSRYTIDHPAIRETLATYPCEVHIHKTDINSPLAASLVSLGGNSAATHAITVEKVQLKNGDRTHTLFRLR